jgi:type II secretory ATPase GspE/PulE/Tfp pilus assembly ATPase PilB-like protein
MTMNVTGMAVLFAELDVPSFSAFPLSGLVVWVVFAALMAAGIAAAVWMDGENKKLAIPQMEWWYLGIGAVLAALLVGTMELGPLMIPAVAVGLPVFLAGFAKQRDKRVPHAQRLLTKDGLGNLLRGLKASSVEKKAAAAKLAALKSKLPSKTFADRLKAASGSLMNVLSKKKKDEKKEEPTFKLLKKDGTSALAQTEDGDDSGNLSENVRLLQEMMIAAMKAGATDIHFEPHEKEYFVRFRVDGVLQNSSTMPIGEGKGVISAFKVVSDMDISERRRPQDGTFSAIFEGTKYDIRSASTPTSYGEKMVMRLLNSSGGVMKAGLGNIGLRTQILDQLRQVIHKPYGMFLVTGPTGSGKTTTVYASLAEIDALQHNITTIEDPVEYRLDGITQIAVNTAAGVTFAGILRSVLRQDPDVLLVGEIRDKETAEIACQASLTGHFVFSTLHANDTVATITRMLDLGLDPMLVQTAVTAVLGQRLARKLCEQCKEAYPPPSDLLERLGIKPGVVKQIYREKGCDACGGSGYKGRLGLHELLVMNDDIRKLITAEPNMNDLKIAARKAGTRSLQTDGLMKVLKGLTSVNEIIRVTSS